MANTPVLRLFYCRPARVGFDRILRDVMIPELVQRPGVVEVVVGRQGPDEIGKRLVASIWSSMAAMTDAMGPDIEASRFRPDLLDQTTDRRLEVLPLSVVMRLSDSDPLLIRLARGRLRTGELHAYAEQVRLGVAADAASGHGPVALHFAAIPPARFTTFSLWRSWDEVATSTGADVKAPISTRRLADLAEFEAEFYEVVPLGPPPRRTGR